MKKLIKALHILLTNKQEYTIALWAYNKNVIVPEYKLAMEIIKYFDLVK